MKKIYLAGPLFSDAEKGFNIKIKKILSEKFDVFLPQEDGGLLVDLLADGVSEKEARRQIFDLDVKAMNEADIIFAILDGRTVDEGTVFELGYMFANGKTCYGLQTDPRRLLPGGNSPMIDGCLKQIFYSTDELLKWVKEG